ncbi:MAG: peptidyl-prolyl cis-trans isomerase, peptidylprolyl isomerase [Candidatus Adlerbacteria bacterium]|nr:peptidyl-prolyl cis-trans isomerase, peptidylprolyl isomerase [Candidatus Adlerbacteria bacterium]
MTKILIGLVGVMLLVTAGVIAYQSAPGPATAVDTYSLGDHIVPATTTPQTTGGTGATTNVNTAKIMHATIHTNKGDITLEFYPQQAPNTVANFIKLASASFYNGTKFHRVIKGFMDQGGDPLTKDDSAKARWGTGGPGYQFNDEVTSANSNTAGTIAMANSGPNTQGSQFFINAVDNHSLDKGYTVFGKVTSGMDVVTAINNVPTDSADRPLDPVIVTSVTVSE